jgi:membrane-associated phospholipid phosphatase
MLLAKNENIEKYGDIIQILIPTIGYGTTLYLDDKEGKKQFYKSFFSTFGTTHLLKRTVQKQRPNNGNNESFPSGHTSASFQGATFIHKRYGLKYAIPAYIGATFVGWSRIYSEKHYTSDVIAGAIIGSSFSYYFTHGYSDNKKSITPIVYSTINSKHNFYGIKVIW